MNRTNSRASISTVAREIAHHDQASPDVKHCVTGSNMTIFCAISVLSRVTVPLNLALILTLSFFFHWRMQRSNAMPITIVSTIRFNGSDFLHFFTPLQISDYLPEPLADKFYLLEMALSATSLWLGQEIGCCIITQHTSSKSSNPCGKFVRF